MTTRNSIIINQLAHGCIPIEQGLSWFNSRTPLEQREILHLCYVYVVQAGATDTDVSLAISNARLKPSYTPCVLLSKGNLKIQIFKTIQLPSEEYEKVFFLLISLLSIADIRRKQKCGGQCQHWWHKDLTDSKYFSEIIA